MTKDLSNPIGSDSEVIAQGGFKTVEGHRKRLLAKGIKAEVICPPGVNLNG